MQGYQFEGREDSPLHFIETSAEVSGGGGGAISNRINQLRSAGPISLASQNRVPSRPNLHNISSTEQHQQHPPALNSLFTSALRKRSSSTHNIAAMQQHANNTEQPFQPLLTTMERPRPASAREQPFNEFPFSQRITTLDRHLGAMPRRLMKGQRSMSYDFGYERGGGGIGGGGGNVLGEEMMPGTRQGYGQLMTGSMIMAPPNMGGDQQLFSNNYSAQTMPLHSQQMHHVVEPIGMQQPAFSTASNSLLAEYQQQAAMVAAAQQQQQQQAQNSVVVMGENNTSRELLARVQQELEETKEKLNSCVNSIKSFWSPELKRERAMRKEDNSKYAILADHLHQLQIEKQNMLSTMHNFETDLRKERELKSKSSILQVDQDALRKRCDDLNKEHRLALRQMEDLEQRLASQGQAMANQEESMRRLVDMLKGKGVRGVEILEADRHEIDRLRGALEQAGARCANLERKLLDKEIELKNTRQELEDSHQEIENLSKEAEFYFTNEQQVQSLQTQVDTKEAKIMALESEIRLLEDGIVTPTTSSNSGIEEIDKTIQTFRNNERMLKSKIEQLTIESSKKNSEVYTIQSKLDVSEKQQQDQNHHIEVLKEQLKQREHKINMLTSDLEDFRKRFKEKEGIMEKKLKQMTSNQTEKRQIEVELSELKEQMDIKERRIILLQKKVENLEDLLNDKENQLINVKTRLDNFKSESLAAKGNKSEMEELFKEKEKQLEKLKEHKMKYELECSEELENQRRINNDLRLRNETLQRDVEEKHATNSDIREEVSLLRQEKFKKESDINQLQNQIMQKTAEISGLQMQLQIQSKKAPPTPEIDYKTTHRLTELESQCNYYLETNKKLTTEIDKLRDALKILESDKMEKTNQYRELDDQYRDAQNKINIFKKNQQTDKRKSSQILDDAKRREDNLQMDIEHFKSQLEEREARIRELDHALKESVKITGDREVYATSREELTRQLEMKISDLRQTIDQMQKERNNFSSQISNLQAEIRDKDNQMKTLEDECFHNYIPEMEKMRKSIQEANLRISSLLKIVQGKSSELTEQDRLSLQGITMIPDLGPYTTNWPAISQNQPPAYGLASGYFPVVNAPSEVGRISHLLQEKEMQLQQQMEELTKLRYQSIEQENQVKALRREMEEKNQQLAFMDNNQNLCNSEIMRLSQSNVELNNQITNTNVELLNLRHSNAELTNQNATLRQSHQELTNQITNCQNLIHERDERIKFMEDNMAQSEVERIKRELQNTITDRDTHIAISGREVEQLKKDKYDLNTSLFQMQQELRERTDRLRQLEMEQSRYNNDVDSMQKKYQAVINQLSEKTDRFQMLEKECYQVQQEEIKRLRSENEDLNHRLSYTQKSVQDRDLKLEYMEKEQYRLNEELNQARKLYHETDSELKTIREELTFREERLKQIQASHTEELNRLKSLNQSANGRTNEINTVLEERERLLKGLTVENERLTTDLEHARHRLANYENEVARIRVELSQRDEKIKIIETEYLRIQNEEVQRYQRAGDELNTRLTVIQKKLEERESRIRKLEQENRDLLDEIHNLRKKNYDLEGQLGSAKQALNQPGALGSAPGLTNFTPQGIPQINAIEVDRLKKQLVEATSHLGRVQKLLQDTQIQYHQTSMERDTIRNQLMEEKSKLEQFQLFVQNKESEIRRREADMNIRQSEETARLRSQNEETINRTNQIRQDLDSREKQIQHHHRDNERLQRENRDLTQRVTTMTNQLTEAQRFCEQAALERDQARAQAVRPDPREKLHNQMQSLRQTGSSTTDIDKYQKEIKELNDRIQILNKQLVDMQSNFDNLTRERDLLKMQVPGMQPSNYSGNISNQSHVIRLTQEVERLNREREGKVKECQELVNQVATLTRDRDQQKVKVRELQQRIDYKGSEQQNTGTWNQATGQHQPMLDPGGRLQALRKDIELKDKQLQQLSNELEQMRTKNNEHEIGVRQLKDKLVQVETELNTVKPDHQRLVRERSEIETWARQVKAALEKKDAEVHQLQQILKQNGGQPIKIEQINHLREPNSVSANSPSWGESPQKLSDLRVQLEQKDQQIAQLTGQLQQSRGMNGGSLYSSGGNLGSVSEELRQARKQILEKDQKISQLNTQLDQLRQESLRSSNSSVNSYGLANQSSANMMSQDTVQQLKLEVDTLKRDLGQKVDTIQRMERDCNEKHIRRIDELQTKLKRCQDEAATITKSLEEQKRAVEERERIIKQIKSEQRQATTVDLERLREEHAHCGDQISKMKTDVENKMRQIRTMEGQMERQMDEILETKQEALTASMCEKEANIALMEMTGARNPKALEMLRTEKNQLQTQLKQLSHARASMQEEKKSRKS